ncbi:MAG: DNA repair protein RadC [Elusimicrobiota bacterium]
MGIAEMEKIEMPREKMLKYGPDRLSEAELMALLLRTGVKGKNVIELASDIVKRFSGREFGYEDLGELKEFCGIGEARACELIACMELGRRRFKNKKNAVYLKPADVFFELREYRNLKKEHFLVLYLDTKNQELKKQVVSIGTLNFSVVHPREVFEEAVKNLAAGIIVAHNHPSGCPQPSQEDIKLTGRLAEAGKILGIELLDHVVVASGGYYSFKENGLI